MKRKPKDKMYVLVFWVNTKIVSVIPEADLCRYKEKLYRGKILRKSGRFLTDINFIILNNLLTSVYIYFQ